MSCTGFHKLNVMQNIRWSFLQSFANLKCAHDDIGHLGRDRGIHILRDRVYWPRMSSDLDNWVSGCDRCLKRKAPTNNRTPLVNITTR